MSRFRINKEPGEEDKYYISVFLVIYRHMFGKFPKFLNWCETPRNAVEGYPTQFSYLTEYTMLNKEDAEKMIIELEQKYEKIISHCEATGDWGDCPFDFENMDLLWCK